MTQSSLQPDSHAAWLRRAIALATENAATGAGGPFGAVIVRDGQLIAEAANSVTRALDPTAHAEVNAIRLACQRLGTFSLAGCTLYASCQPCPMCLASAYWARVDALYYAGSAQDAARAGFDDAFIYSELEKAPAQRQLPQLQLLREEAWASFAAWMASVKRVEY